VRRYVDRLRSLAFSATAKDTYILFVGNIGTAFWGFVFTLIVARSISIPEFGVFSAVLNLAAILSSLSDFGISSGAVNFIASNYAKGDIDQANKYAKAAFLIRLTTVLSISGLVLVLSPLISTRLLATTDWKMGIWVAAITAFWFLALFVPNLLQAKGKFLKAVIYDNSYYLGRLIFAFVFYVTIGLTLNRSFWAFGAGFLMTLILTFIYLGKDLIYAKPKKSEYHNLLKFSGWIGVNRVISSISGKLDIQMLAVMSGALATGLFSIPSRLATFIVVLASSFSSVLAPRMAGFDDSVKEKAYIIKSTLALIPISAGIIFWIIIAKPFMLLLFGSKYLPAVPIFQALAASMIPFLFTVPSVTAIIYAMKKTVYIGAYSFFQIAAIFLLNFYFIPKFGPIGPTITLGITNTILAIYTWVIVVRHYWFQAK